MKYNVCWYFILLWIFFIICWIVIAIQGNGGWLSGLTLAYAIYSMPILIIFWLWIDFLLYIGNKNGVLDESEKEIALKKDKEAMIKLELEMLAEEKAMKELNARNNFK